MTIVDRNARDRVATEVRKFLEGEATAFEFDDAIFEIQTSDSTVHVVVLRLWCYYDDLEDHRVRLTKPEWDYFQRLLLVLESDRHIVSERTTSHWRLTQFVALVALAGFALCVWQLGFGKQLLAISIPFGMISMGICYWRRSSLPVLDNAATALIPFSSVAEMCATYKNVGLFCKTRYRDELSGSRPIRSPFATAIMWIPAGMVWLMFSPVVLFYQMLPDRDSRTRVGSSV